MASNDDRCSTDNKASIALLRRLRAGDHVHFVHHVDVCDAVPEVLVADLEPVPGTGVHDDGYGRIWYLYHAKKFTNTQVKLSGHRHRMVTGGGGACWHQETRKNVEGSAGGTYCTLSYGRKKDPSARSIDRLGWCMTEYDIAAADEQQAAAASNYVLCKVYRSPRAKGKSAPASASASASSSSKNKKASAKQTAKKRKAGVGDHPEAPPAKYIHQQEPQYQPQGVESEHVDNFNFNIEDIHFYVDENMLRDEPEPGLLQQPISDPKHDVEFIQLPCGPVLPAVPEATFEDMLGPGPETMYGGGMTTASIPWSSYAPATLYTGCSSLLQGPDPLHLPYLTC